MATRLLFPVVLFTVLTLIPSDSAHAQFYEPQITDCFKIDVPGTSRNPAHPRANNSTVVQRTAGFNLFELRHQ